MTKKDIVFKWTQVEKDYFEKKIKATISTTPVLIILDFDKDFFLYTFTSISLERKMRGVDFFSLS
jgi:hypothetical protein